jgi:hypothetical protein
MRAIFLLTCALLFIFSNVSRAQQKEIDTVQNFTVKVPEQKRFYTGNGLDFIMLSTAIVSKPGKTTHLTMPRFTAIVNLGFTFNYDLDSRIGFFSGIGLRNMGFIEKIGDSTIKRRVYSLGVPLGVKIGNLRNRNFVFLGGGIDVPLHYREKSFRDRGDKDRINEWFSDRTRRVMPFAFVGYSFDPGVTLKLQYYPGNFLNDNYEERAKGVYPGVAPLVKPYAGYSVHLLLLSLGIDIHYNQYRIQEREYQEMKKQRQQTNLL